MVMDDRVEQVILVDEHDKETGLAPKLQAHLEGLRHRAISVLIFNDKGEMLLQQRHAGKYHSGGLWTNACCSHPRAGENTETAAHRRLQDEMGFDVPLTPMFIAHYRAPVGELIEDEVVHVFGGHFEGAPQPEPSEVDAYRWISFDDLVGDMKARPDVYTVWFRKYVAEYHTRILELMQKK
jgi:isopentenyl-diphosphate Delta-isomerase